MKKAGGRERPGEQRPWPLDCGQAQQGSLRTCEKEREQRGRGEKKKEEEEEKEDEEKNEEEGGHHSD